MEFGSRYSCLVSGLFLVLCRGSDIHAPGLVLLWTRVVSSSLGPCAPLSVCIRCLRFAFSCFVLFCVACSLCFSTGYMFLCLSCFVWTRNLWVSLLAACSCPGLHMACDSVLLAMCLYFCFVWAHGFCHSFCVPCAVMSIVLTPPILYPDYWLNCPTCVSLLPSSFAPFIISLCLQSCVRSSSNVVCAWCPVLSCPVLSCPVLSCPVLSCPVLSCPVLPCPALSCQSVFPYGVVFVCLFHFIFNKALFLQQLSPRSHPFHPPWRIMHEHR